MYLKFIFHIYQNLFMINFFKKINIRYFILLIFLSFNSTFLCLSAESNNPIANPIAKKEAEEGYDDDDDEEDEKREINYKTFDEQDIKFRRKLWKEINLKEPTNEGFYYRNYEMVKFIIAGVEKGLLRPFTDFTKKKRMTKEQFKRKLLVPISSQSLEEDEDSWGEEPKKKNITKQQKNEYFFPCQVTILELEEELLFHGRRSEWSFNPLSIKLVLPQYLFDTKLKKNVAVFDFKELMDYLDKTPGALWRNDINTSNHKKFSTAFKERLFDYVLRKIENPKDDTIAEMYGAQTEKEALIASYKEEAKLRSMMDKIWIP
ncbi:MAG: hypothetical protein GY830_10475 [Bacteroidetes bacterium]|nr:hypothetical protein [Bacteroidota bacterium]